MKEWDFDVDSQDVDLDRLHIELSNISASGAMSYMYELIKNAPIVYGRYRDREKVRCGDNQVWNWDNFDKYLNKENV